MLYRHLIRPAVFSLWNDPEDAHEFAMGTLEKVSRSKLLLETARLYAQVRDPRLERTLWGLTFPNPIGLAGGFDKNCRALRGFEALGFGFIEAGTITRYAQPGNDRPRVFRYARDKAIINRFGFNNVGSEATASRLADPIHRPRRIPLGVSLGKSKITPNEQAVDDYIGSLRLLYAYGDYFAVNVSSPNTPGLRKLQDSDALDTLLEALMAESALLAEATEGQPRKPLLVKIAPDLEPEALDELLAVCTRRNVDGLIATNTTLSRDGLDAQTEEAGGLSGRPLFARSLAIVRHIRRRMPEIPIIGVGGILTPQNAYDMLRAGADLLQVYTGLIYQGPFFPKTLNHGLLRYMDEASVANVQALSAINKGTNRLPEPAPTAA